MKTSIYQVTRCVIVPDLHEDIAWASRVLEQEKEAGADIIAFLGDYFDTAAKHNVRVGKRAVCDWLLQVREEWRGRSLFLLGNHDVQYLESKPACEGHHQPRGKHFYRCGSAFTAAGAHNVAKGLPQVFWDDARLFAVVNGYLLSHAGLARAFWPMAANLDQALEALQQECEQALLSISHRPHRLLDAGKVRGGDAAIGGLTWLDWNEEFADDLPLPQIVGHTGDNSGARRRGRSWCIDGRQTCYGILTPNGFSVVPNEDPS